MALEYVASIPSLPTSVIKTQEGSVYSHIAAPLKYFISITWTHSRY